MAFTVVNGTPGTIHVLERGVVTPVGASRASSHETLPVAYAAAGSRAVPLGHVSHVDALGNSQVAEHRTLTVRGAPSVPCSSPAWVHNKTPYTIETLNASGQTIEQLWPEDISIYTATQYLPASGATAAAEICTGACSGTDALGNTQTCAGVSGYPPIVTVAPPPPVNSRRHH